MQHMVLSLSTSVRGGLSVQFECLSSGESIVSMQHLVYVTLCRWPSGIQVGEDLPDLHTGRSPTQSDIYQMLHWYSWLSWWWAQGCSKHV